MQEVLLYHPRFGFKHARHPVEITNDQANGWHVHADLVRLEAESNAAPHPTADPPVGQAVEPGVDAAPESGIVRRSRRRIEKAASDDSDGAPTG